MPIRGHSGVQGGAEMGAYATAFPGGKPINAENAAALSQAVRLSRSRPARASPPPRWSRPRARGELDLLYCLGGNFLRTLPEPDYVAQRHGERAAARAPGHHPHRPDVHRRRGEEVILLPAKTRYEQDDGGTETTTERRIVFSPEIPRQVGEARAEWKILRDLAAAAYPERAAPARLRDRPGDPRGDRRTSCRSTTASRHLRKTGDAFQYGGARSVRGRAVPTARWQSALPRLRCRRCIVRRACSTSPPGVASSSTR